MFVEVAMLLMLLLSVALGLLLLWSAIDNRGVQWNDELWTPHDPADPPERAHMAEPHAIHPLASRSLSGDYRTR